MIHNDSSLNIAKRAVKIAIGCVFCVVVIGVLVFYVLFVQIEATAGISKRLDEQSAQISAQLRILKDKINGLSQHKITEFQNLDSENFERGANNK